MNDFVEITLGEIDCNIVLNEEMFLESPQSCSIADHFEFEVRSIDGQIMIHPRSSNVTLVYSDIGGPYLLTLYAVDANGNTLNVGNSIFVVYSCYPPCTFLLQPINNSIAVPVNTDLVWEISDNASGYRLTIGTTSGGNDILDNIDVGNVTFYNPEEELPCGSNIYVTITPYNLAGYGEFCEGESFSTEILIANAISFSETANNASDGIATVDPFGGTPPYTYLWNNGETTQTIENLPPNDYTVTVTDDNGCTSIETVVVYEFNCPTLTINSSKNNVTCNGSCNGIITLNSITNGTAPFTYIWNTGATTNSISGLCAGIYSVTVTDANNCIVIGNFTITQPEILLANTTATPETANNANDGTATANPTGGTAPYTYLWSNGATTQSIIGVTPAIYTVTVTDANNCTATGSAIVTEFGCSGLSLNTVQQNVKCFGECNGSINIISVQNGTAPFTYLWNNGQTTSFIQNLCAGIYSVTVTDSINCVVYGSYTIIEPALLQVNTSSTSETANGANDGTASANPSGGVPPYVYHWSNGQTTQTITGLVPGSYGVTVTDFNLCQAIDSVSIGSVVCDSLQINSYQINETCAGYCDGAIAILCIENAEYPVKYKWSTGSEAPLINNLCAGEYTVTVTDSNNCSTIAKFTIISESQINISIDSIINITSTTAGAIFLSVDAGNYTISWTGPNNYSSTLISLTNLQKPGCYTLVITDNDTGCTLDTTICITDITSVSDLEGNNKIFIYPNPTNEFVNIDLQELSGTINDIIISDISGKKIISFKLLNGQKFYTCNTKHLSSGFYVIHIWTESKIYHKKLEIVR